MATIKGTKGNDRLSGTADADVIIGLAGDDRLLGDAGTDVLKPGAGADTLLGGSGDDLAIVVDFAEATPDRFDGGTGRDTLDLSNVPPLNYPVTWDYDPATGGYTVARFGQPAALGFTRVEAIVATGEDDTVDFYDSPDGFTFDGGDGNDRIGMGAGNDVVRGGAGDDSIGGGDGRNQLYGGVGDDALFIGFDGYGLLDGGAGRDTGSFTGRVDLARGYAVAEDGRRIRLVSIEDIGASFFSEPGLARGDDRANTISADGARNGGTLQGEGGDDVLIGSEYGDRLVGGDGRDTLTGGLGADMLIGGRGADVFGFVDDFFGRPDATDTIRDFSRQQGDRIDLSGVDAKARTEGTDAFTFIGTDAFSGRGGELRYVVGNGVTHVQADTDADGRADLRFDLTGEVRLVRADFILTPEAI